MAEAEHIPRKHIETVAIPRQDSGREEERSLTLGAWIAIEYSRVATLTPERIEQLPAVGKRSV